MNIEARREALDVLKNRHSHRVFIDKPIEKEVLDEILEVGLHAAAGGNLQPISVIMIREPERKKYLRELLGAGFIEKADTLLIFVLDYYRLKRWTEVQKAPFGRQQAFRDFIIGLEDVMCMAQSMECAANLLGVGNVYIGGVNRAYDELKEYLDLPALTIPILMTCLGYSTDKGMGRKKLAREYLVHEEKYKRMSDEDVLSGIVNDKYDNWIQPLEGEVLEKYITHFTEVTDTVNGPEWTKEVIAKIKEQGGINRAQYRFGWHYNPLRQRSYNEKIFAFLEKQGFEFLPK